jgi:hypothetical protein
MIYSISIGRSYSSSFNILAVIAGIFLMRGSLGAVRVVTWFTAFSITGFLAAIVLLVPFFQPLDLSIAQIRFHPTYCCISIIIGLFLIGLLFWIYKELRSPLIIQALSAHGKNTRAPKSALIVGGLLVIIISIVINLTLKGEASHKAIALARGQLGLQYKYHLRAMHWEGDHVRADVTAYNQAEIKTIEVQWDK